MPIAALPKNYKDVPTGGAVKNDDIFLFIREVSSVGEWKKATYADVLNKKYTAQGSIGLYSNQTGVTLIASSMLTHVIGNRCFINLIVTITNPNNHPALNIGGLQFAWDGDWYFTIHNRNGFFAHTSNPDKFMFTLETDVSGSSGGDLSDPLSGMFIISGSYKIDETF